MPALRTHPATHVRQTFLDREARSGARHEKWTRWQHREVHGGEEGQEDLSQHELAGIAAAHARAALASSILMQLGGPEEDEDSE